MGSRIVVIGGAGEMNREALKRVSVAEPDVELVLTDINSDAVAAFAGELGGKVQHKKLDLYDEAEVRSTIRGASLVLNGAGPYVRTAKPVMDACLAERVAYLDFDDDTESTVEALEMDRAARDAGVSIMIGCGASPGYSNVLALDVASQLDEVDSIDAFWCSGDEGDQAFGAAVLEHAINMYHGEILSARLGKRTRIQLGDSEIVDMGEGLGHVRLYEVAHPEPVTLLRRFPEVQSARCLGGFDPGPVNGIFKGLAQAVDGGELAMEEAIEFLQAVLTGGDGGEKPWRYALSGIWEQVRQGEGELEEMLGFIRASAAGQHAPYVGKVLVRASGRKDGRPTTVVRRSGWSETQPWLSMADFTGACTAAFITMGLKTPQSPGVLSPEDWVSPKQFYATLESHGAAPELTVEPDYLFSVAAEGA